MEQLLGVLRNEKISSSVLVLILLGAWYTYGWAEDRYVAQGDFDELKGLIVTHLEDMQIVNTSQLIRDKKLALQLAQSTGESDAHLATQQDAITKAETYKDCLIGKKPNCKHLRPAE